MLQSTAQYLIVPYAKWKKNRRLYHLFSCIISPLSLRYRAFKCRTAMKHLESSKQLNFRFKAIVGAHRPVTNTWIEKRNNAYLRQKYYF